MWLVEFVQKYALVIYIISMIVMIIHVNIEFGWIRKQHMFATVKPSFTDYMVAFAPVLNTGLAIIVVIVWFSGAVDILFRKLSQFKQ